MTVYADDRSHPALIAREFDRSRRRSLKRHNEHVLHDSMRRKHRRIARDALGIVAGAVCVYGLIVILSVLA